MFGEQVATRKVIGDVDIVYHDGLYHLFHLVLPNHDFIAHAVSENGINWRRIRNALFIGDPGSWDDLMLWTMHVSPDPWQDGRWRMFYTGLSRREQGRIQRVGLAVSDDLYAWQKVPVNWEDRRGPNDPGRVKEAVRKARQLESTSANACFDSASQFPLEADPQYYESSLAGQRQWISCRDPFYFRQGQRAWLLAATRVNSGPLVRRGCVGLFEEVAPNQFEARPPLHHPELYDDIEVPNLVMLQDRYYLIGSIREDAKIRYWHSDAIGNPWASHSDNVLLASGNYAGRICTDGQGVLLWNFFSCDASHRTLNNLLPPPKRLTVDDKGQLCPHTFEGFDAFLRESIDTHCIFPLKDACERDHVRPCDDNAMELVSEGRFQAFVFEQTLHCFQFRGRLRLVGEGKCGVIFRIDPQTHDGYYLSLDLMKGVAQLRAWGTDRQHVGERMMKFESLQEGYWRAEPKGEAEIKLLAFGSYLELSVNGRMVLSLADQTYRSGLVGIYAESAKLMVEHPEIHRLQSPTQTDEHLAQGFKRK